jgi:HSP20 family protein
MAIIRYPGPFGSSVNTLQEMVRVRREMDRLFSGLVGTTHSASVSGVFPALNVREDSDKYYLEAEVPGIKAEDIHIDVEGNTVSIGGERKLNGMENVSYHRRERRAGKFKKAISLPMEVNAEAVSAECKDGVLRLVLPKAESAKPKKITIKGS